MRIVGLAASAALLGAVSWCSAQSFEFAAASGVITPPFVVTGDSIMQTNDTAIEEGGRAVYELNITNAGEFVVETVISGAQGKQGALLVCFDNETVQKTNVWKFDPTSSPNRQKVGFVKGKVTNCNYQVYKLEAGQHRLYVRGATGGVKLYKLSVRPNIRPAQPRGLTAIQP